MKPRRRLQVYTLGAAASVYALRDPASTLCEPDRFFVDPSVRANSDYNALVNRVRRSGPRRGFRREWFRDERGAWALFAPHPDGATELEHRFPPSLRLYCLRLFQDHIIVLGHGGIKGPGTSAFQDDPLLDAAVRDLEALDVRLQARLKLGDIALARDPAGHPILEGTLTFGPDDIP